MKNITLVVQKKDDLIDYLVSNTDYSKNKIKSLLKYKKISVNNKIVEKLPLNVINDDKIVINLEKDIKTPFDIIYEDDEIIVVDKQPGLLTIGTSTSDTDTLYRQVREYSNKNKNQVFIVNRLDKETSGIVMFAKSERIKMLYQNNWNELVSKRGYIAIVEGIVKNDGRIENYLYEEPSTFVHSSKIGKKAITNYRVIKSNGKYTMLDVNIETGRKNQIRVHMSEMGHPIIGDKKYGSKTDPIKRMGLHSYILVINHPISREKLVFESAYPKAFERLMYK